MLSTTPTSGNQNNSNDNNNSNSNSNSNNIEISCWNTESDFSNERASIRRLVDNFRNDLAEATTRGLNVIKSLRMICEHGIRSNFFEQESAAVFTAYLRGRHNPERALIIYHARTNHYHLYSVYLDHDTEYDHAKHHLLNPNANLAPIFGQYEYFLDEGKRVLIKRTPIVPSTSASSTATTTSITSLSSVQTTQIDPYSSSNYQQSFSNNTSRNYGDVEDEFMN